MIEITELEFFPVKSILSFLILLFYSQLYSQSLTPFILPDDASIAVDGIFSEEAWTSADSISRIFMVEPSEGLLSSFNTTIKIISDQKTIYVGVTCYDPDPDKIVSFSKGRDSDLGNEDNIKFVFDTFNDGRRGYIFAVNPFGSRYDALVSDFGEEENSNWDGSWEAVSRINKGSWTAEIAIPVQNFSFDKNSDEWGFNIERRIQRLLETDRWTGIKQDYYIGQVVHAGKLKGLPVFDLGIGLTTRLSAISHAGRTLNSRIDHEADIGLDLDQKITPNVTAQLTVNTDFAETEVDARQTNLTRFPLFYPEKRTFFIQGSDIYDFGLGTSTDVIPFFSRRIGLYASREVPILFGGKLNGQISGTSFGMLFTRMKKVDGLVPYSSLGVMRIKQNLLEESSVGVLATYGDPAGDKNAWLAGMDLTYQTSHFLGDKNFLAGAWGILNNKRNLTGDKSAFGLKIDYPNDLWDVNFIYFRIGDAFSPSLGFVPRTGITQYHFGVDYMPRPDWNSIRQFFFMSGISLVTNLNNQWESYSGFIAPLHFLLESGDSFEFAVAPEGENLKEPFQISDGVILQNGEYNWVRYGLEVQTASKRMINGEAGWWFGSFYDGTLDFIEVELSLRPLSYLILQLELEKNIVRLPQGNFDQDLFGGRVELNLSSDFQLSSLVQYDNESGSMGTNTRLRWTFDILGDLFIVYNHNINKLKRNMWQYDSNELVIKLSYGFWK